MLTKIQIYLIAVIAFASTGLHATHGGQFKEIDGIAIYFAILPAEMLRGHPKNHPESTMHAKERIEGVNQHHIMVSLFNAKTGVRLRHAVVRAIVIGTDFTGKQKPLEHMTMGGEQSYGNFFNVPKQGAYRVKLEIEPYGKGKFIDAMFQYGNA